MTKLTNPTYIKLRDLILKSEGKKLEDELGFGCYFKWNYDLWFTNCVKCVKDRIFAFSCAGSAHSWPDYMNENEQMAMRYQIFNKDDIKEFEILGLPISLDRVLVALNKLYGHIVTYYLSSESELGVLEQDDPYHNFRFSLKVNLGQPLHLQPLETIEKIVEILEDK